MQPLQFKDVWQRIGRDLAKENDLITAEMMIDGLAWLVDSRGENLNDIERWASFLRYLELCKGSIVIKASAWASEFLNQYRMYILENIEGKTIQKVGTLRRMPRVKF